MLLNLRPNLPDVSVYLTLFTHIELGYFTEVKEVYLSVINV